MASRIRTLNAAANLWEVRPPLAGMEAEDSKQFWWREWQKMTVENCELLKWAQQQCIQNPLLSVSRRGDTQGPCTPFCEFHECSGQPPGLQTQDES